MQSEVEACCFIVSYHPSTTFRMKFDKTFDTAPQNSKIQWRTCCLRQAQATDRPGKQKCSSHASLKYNIAKLKTMLNHVQECKHAIDSDASESM